MLAMKPSNRIPLFICVFFATLLAPYCISAQWYDPEKINKKAAAIYGEAYENAQEGLYNEAIAKLNDALKYEPKFVDVYLSRAGIYANLKNYSSSVADFEKGLELDSVYAKTYLLPYSISLAGTGNFEKAMQMVEAFLATPRLNEQSIKAGNYRKKTFAFALQQNAIIKSKTYVFSPKNMGNNINSNSLEYYPSLTIDGSKMIFTRREDGDEDFYESSFLDGIWSKAIPVPGKINTNLNEGAQNISQDGEWLIFTGCNYPEGAGSCDLYISYKTKNGSWTEGENLGNIINTDFWEASPSLSPDKSKLYFASSRLGGYGGKDIWVSTRQINGKWGKPENLGPEINTPADEGCPFIHPDNQTLYFNSNGHEGYGLTDLFLVRKKDDNSWGTPLNLGYPINTIDDEGSLIVAADGKTGFYASDGADTKGGLDLYEFELRDDIRASKVLWVKGRVYDVKNNNGLPSAVELTDINTRKLLSKIQTDEDGNYLITLPVDKNYAFNVNRKGYLFYSDNFETITGHTDTALQINIPLQPLEAGATIILKNIFFASNEFVIKAESEAELNNLLLLLRDNPTIRIMISGHTDNVGNASNNLTLSSNRARSVLKFLQQNGIEANRLISKGWGATKPVADNITEEGRAKNRRTELSILK
jgi:tetratricopeptide (TPR) repeat protein